MDYERIALINGESAFNLAKDAKIVSLRWDLIPWSLVLDCDVKEDELETTQTKRAWFIFNGISELSLSMTAARMVNGVFILHPIEVSGSSDGFSLFTLPVVTPSFNNLNQLVGNPHNTIVVKAIALSTAKSVAGTYVENNGLTRSQRNSLASQDELLKAIQTVFPPESEYLHRG